MSSEFIEKLQSDITDRMNATDRVISPTPFDRLASAAQIVIDTEFGGKMALNVQPKSAAINAAIRYLAQTLSRLNQPTDRIGDSDTPTCQPQPVVE